MTVRYVRPSREELEGQHADLLGQLHMTREELEDAAESGLLHGEQFWLYQEVKGVEFLLDAG